ncbi:MAG: hypothetical protein Q4D60_07745 [Eubacteriales bacterium]|nr:hypothetical protein [Eubacteriales bacterium]
MKLDLRGSRIVKCEFHNEMGPNTKLNLQVSVNNQIKLPKGENKKAAGSIITKIMIGTPLQPLYLLLEQVSNYMDVEEEGAETLDMDSLMSLYKTICVPLAVQEVESTIKKLSAIYHFPEISIQKNGKAGKPDYLS